MILADRIVELRKKKGWSQEELAEAAGVSRFPSGKAPSRCLILIKF